MKVALTSVALVAMLITPALAEGDAAKGEKVFKKCKACHMVGPDAKAKVGPPLNNLFGATAGKPEGYEYKFSKAMMEAGEGGLVWNDETLDQYLAKPRDMVKGTKMSFAGLNKEEDRADIIAYLKTFSSGEAGEMKKEGEEMKKEGDMKKEGEMKKDGEMKEEKPAN